MSGCGRKVLMMWGDEVYKNPTGDLTLTSFTVTNPKAGTWSIWVNDYGEVYSWIHLHPPLWR